MNKPDKQQETGELTPLTLKQGPTAQRSCTDICCCLIFLTFQIAVIAVAIYAFKNGDYRKIAQPFDPDHRPCGIDGQANYPYIYFVAPSPTTLYRTVCVEKCPATDTDTLNCLINSEVKSCDKNYYKVDAAQQFIIYASTPFAGRVCVPKSTTLYAQISSSMQGDQVENAINDLKNTWMIISISALIAIIISFAFLCVLRMCAGVVVWSFIFVIIIGLFLMGLFFYLKYTKLVNVGTIDSGSSASSEDVQSDMAKKFSDPNLCLYVSIIFFLLGAIMIIIVICLCKKIRRAIAILKCSSRFITETPSVMLISPISFVVMCLCFIWWFVVIIFLFGCGEVSQTPRQLPFGQFKYSSQIKSLSWFNFLSFLWNCMFLMDAADFVVMGAVCYWYFQRQQQQNHTKLSARILMKFHIGTVALGSFLTSLILFLRIVLEFFFNQSKTQNPGPIARLTMKCCKCCLWCFQKCVQFINKQAYIQTIMQNKSFCPAAKDGISLVIRNPITFAMNSGLGFIFQILGTLCITVATTLICYTVITTWSYYTEILTSPVYPTLCFGILSFCVSSFFMGIYGISADTIVVLFAMDEEMSKNAPQKSTNTPPELQEFLNQK